MVKLTAKLFQEKIISLGVEKALQSFQWTIREHNGKDVNEATSELTSTFQSSESSKSSNLLKVKKTKYSA